MGGLVFQAPCPSYHPLEYQGELLWVPRVPGRPVHFGIPCLLLQHPGATHLLHYFHANAEDLGMVRDVAVHLAAELGLHVLATEYPGYGICSGEAGEKLLLEDALAVLDFGRDELQVPPGRTLLMGRSIGSGPAVFLASRHECAGLITLAAFSSLRTVVGSFLGWGGWFPDLFDNETRIRSVSCPTLLVHGSEDETVQVGQARELANACGADAEAKPTVLLSIRPNVGHNNLDLDEDVVQPMKLAFPDLQQGRPLELSAADTWLRRRAQGLAPDVVERVPYTPDCVPCSVSAG